MTILYRGKTIRQWAKEKGLTVSIIHNRIRNGLLPELILAKKSKANKFNKVLPDEVSDDFEAWGDLTPEQLETMREFDQIGRIAKC